MLLTLLVPLLGFWLYKPANQIGVTLTGDFIGNPTLAGALGGVILFVLLTLFELDRVHKNGTDKLTDTIVSPLTLYLARIISLLVAATAAGLVTTMIYLPYTLHKVGYLFEWSTYWGCWLLIFLPALWIGCLLAAVFYQVTRRFDLSLMLVVVVAIPCFMQGMGLDFMLRWINPDVPFLSDMFGNSLVMQITAWSRCFHLALLAGLYILTLLCVRRYGKNALVSFIRNGRRFYKPLLGIVLIVFAVNLYMTQPYVSRAARGIYDPLTGEDTYRSYIAYGRSSDVELYSYWSRVRIYTLLKPDMEKGTLEGYTKWSFPNSTEWPVYMQINRGLSVYSVTVNEEPVNFKYVDDNATTFRYVVLDVSHIKGELEITAEYGGRPVVWREHMDGGLFVPVVSRQYLGFDGNKTEHNEESVGFPPNLWAPNIFSLLTGGVITDQDKYTNAVEIVLPDNFLLVNDIPEIDSYGTHAVAKPRLVSENGDGTNTWRMNSLYFMGLQYFAADYVHERVDMGYGRGVDVYYARRNQRLIEEYDAMEKLRRAFEYCTENFQANPQSNITYVQIPGPREIEFSAHTLANEWQSGSGRNSMSYKVISSWWLGMDFRLRTDNQRLLDAIEKAAYEDIYASVPQEWNMDGITEYIAYRFAAKEFGEEYAKTAYVDVWKENVRDYYTNFYVRNPQYINLLSVSHANRLGQMQRDLLCYYSMPLKIYKAAEMIGGHDMMMTILAQMHRVRLPATKLDETYSQLWNRITEYFTEKGYADIPIRQPGTNIDSWMNWLYALYSNQGRKPDKLTEFREQANLDAIFHTCGVSIENGDWEAVIMRDMYNAIVESYSPARILYYEDFLAYCGLVEEHLYLTADDWKL